MLHRNFLTDNQKASYTALNLPEASGDRPNHVWGVAQNWDESSHLPSQEHLHQRNTKLNGSSCQHEQEQEKMKEAPSIVSESATLYQHVESRFIRFYA